MGKTHKDQRKWDNRNGKDGRKKPKFPRVPPILKRSEPFDDRRDKVKYPDADLIEGSWNWDNDFINGDDELESL